ncbi:MAG: polyprenyl synthetase family protein [Candidatus Diapherotrites archaeon]
MKKKDYSAKSIREDRTIGGMVDASTEFFEGNVRQIIENEIETYVGAWPLKKAFLDSIEGGKRLRAFATYLFYRLADGKKENGAQIAAAMELIHCASLVIDDELDKRNVRPDRNVPTMRGKYSPEEAMMVMALDVLFAENLVVKATEEFSLEKKNKIRDLFVRTVCDGGMGEILKWKYIQDRKIPTKKTYWQELVRSSGALFFQMACEIGALTATDDKQKINKITLIGYKLGELLQAGDDIKDIKEDMRDGFYSLGVINYYESLSGANKAAFEKKLKQGFSEQELDSVYAEIIHSAAMEKTFHELRQKGKEILELLGGFNDSKEKKILVGIVEFLTDRMALT